MTKTTNIIARIPAEHFVTVDDGFVAFWPEPNRGFLSAHDLRAIADELDRRNAPWAAEVGAYFDAAKTPPTEADGVR